MWLTSHESVYARTGTVAKRDGNEQTTVLLALMMSSREASCEPAGGRRKGRSLVSVMVGLRGLLSMFLKAGVRHRVSHKRAAGHFVRYQHTRAVPPQVASSSSMRLQRLGHQVPGAL